MSTSAILQVQDLCVAFGGLTALDQVSLTLDRGELLAIVGPNGAGKTSLLNLITRVTSPDRGRVHFEKTDLLALPPHRLVDLGIARTFQNLALAEVASVRDNLLLGGHRRAYGSVAAQLLALPSAGRRESDLQRDVDAIAERLGLGTLRDVRVGDLPYGWRKRVELARALVARPRLLLLDEPASGLAAVESAWIGELLLALRKEQALTVLMIEHDMSLVRAVADRVVVLDQGRVLAEGASLETLADARVAAAYLGLS